MLIEIAPAAGTLGIVARSIDASREAGSFLAGYLNNDIQGSAEHAQDVLHHLDAVQSGREPAWSESGNAYVIAISPEAVTLDFHWVGEGKTTIETISAGDLRAALQAWVDTLEQKSA
jgi:hypothetical protein